MGGLLGYKSYPSHGYIIDTVNEKVQRLNGDLKFVSWGNSCEVVAPGQVTGLVKDRDDNLKLVSYDHRIG